MSRVAVVIPTIGRRSLHELLESLAVAVREPFDELIVVDDRRSNRGELPEISVNGTISPTIARNVKLLRTHGRGPAAARNAGWREATSEWICFLDDDVVVTRDWHKELEGDLARAAQADGSQAVIEVPLPSNRRPTDWEHNVAGLASAQWITADMAYRRDSLVRTGGFDERFPQAYREDADLALRVTRNGGVLVGGRRRTLHRPPPADRWVSVRLQRGNADDVLMRALHGAQWRRDCGAGRGLFPLHVAIVVSSLTWLALVGGFTYTRIARGPRTLDEIVTMLLTSAMIPYAAVYYRVCALLDLPRTLATEPRSEGR